VRAGIVHEGKILDGATATESIGIERLSELLSACLERM
jgi:hypothetical protein